MLIVPGAGAATIDVTDPADDFFASPGGTCALREAVQAANTDADFGPCVRSGTGTADTIVLDGGQVYTRSRSGFDDTNQNGDLDITGRTTIEVTGEGKAAIEGNFLDRVFEVHSGGTLRGSKLIVRHGLVPFSGTSPGGGGIRVHPDARLNLRSSTLVANESAGNGGCSCGGALRTDGRTRLNRVAVNDNDAGNLAGGIAFLGGDLVVRRSSIARNDSGSSAGGIHLGGFAKTDSAIFEATTVSANFAGGEGGGFSVSPSGGPTLRATNVTISGNEANGRGGGVFLFSGMLRLNAATITRNTADADENTIGDGGGVYGSTVRLRNSIVVRNVDLNAGTEDCAGFPEDFFHNLVGRDTGCTQSAPNITTRRPRLKPLDDYGGPTMTHALRRRSPAIGEANANTAPNRDQRGVKRDARPDIGSFER